MDTINKRQQRRGRFRERVWIESKLLWQIVGPAIFSRVSSYSMNVITQAFTSHIGDLELVSLSITNNVIVGFNYGLLLGMASALETLCGQAFGAKKFHKLGIYLQRSWIVLFLFSVLLLPMYVFATSILKWMGQPEDVAEQSGMVVMNYLRARMWVTVARTSQSKSPRNMMGLASLICVPSHRRA
ncbi:protein DETOXIFICATION 27-like [Telopea speciosissima]|uniref:protein DETOXIFICATION 27-like n=1 Tax=Telopea speciosissima TaxID=54955 RepID=UPI001CC59861|nr:protein DETOXIFICATION 27-like [Telopea speciosissima]